MIRAVYTAKRVTLPDVIFDRFPRAVITDRREEVNGVMRNITYAVFENQAFEDETISHLTFDNISFRKWLYRNGPPR